MEVIGVGELSEMPMHWRDALWEYVQAYPASGCHLGPFLAITEEQRCTFIRQLAAGIEPVDNLAVRSLAHDIGQFAAYEYELVEPAVEEVLP